MIKRVGPHKYVVMSADGKPLSKPSSKASTTRRFAQIEATKKKET